MARRNNSGASSRGRKGASKSSRKEGSFSGRRKSSGMPSGKSNAGKSRKQASFSGNQRSLGQREEASGSHRKARPFKNQSTSNKRKDDNTPGSDRSEKKFKKGPSFGLPYKRAYGKKTDSPSGRPFVRNDENDFPENGPASGKRMRDKLPGESHHSSKSFFKKSKSTYPDAPGKRIPEEEISEPKKIRLNKYISNSGVCSRREADELISMGLVSVNGKTITELGYKVNPGDEVRYENKILKAEKPVYILLNKPRGYLTTTDDPQERETVMHIIGSAVKERIYPVGRLDRNTTGLLLLTNDGDLAEKLMHPSYNVKKIYKAELDKPLTKAHFQAVREGVKLEEGRAVVDDIAIVSDDGKTVGLEIHIGWNRVVRRIFESLGYNVVRLDRSVYAGLDKKDLGRGQWRFLKKEEVVRLKHFK